uniref:Uncharacterized protein n=1 Tax=Anguilla anguilla TaxID=7936 RepID=A0A0E9RMC5_ANGAN
MKVVKSVALAVALDTSNTLC